MMNHDALSPTRGASASELEADLQLDCSHVHRPIDGAEPCRRRAEASRIDVAVREKLRVANRLVLRADELQLGDARVVDDRVQRVVHLHAKPNLLFLDIHMPELDGFGVLRASSSEPAGASRSWS
jgi:CheY-like chemotaxis protein